MKIFLLVIFLSTFLGGCVSTLLVSKSPAIEIEPGTRIKTSKGLYIAEEQETWYSEEYVDKLKSMFSKPKLP